MICSRETKWFLSVNKIYINLYIESYGKLSRVKSLDSFKGVNLLGSLYNVYVCFLHIYLFSTLLSVLLVSNQSCLLQVKFINFELLD